MLVGAASGVEWSKDLPVPVCYSSRGQGQQSLPVHSLGLRGVIVPNRAIRLWLLGKRAID